MKKSQKGFAALEGLLILIIVGIVGFTGWYVYHARNAATSDLNSAANTQVAVSSSSSKKLSDNCKYNLELGAQTGAAGTYQQDLVFTNTSTKTCTLTGYPTVSTTDASGKAVGTPVGSQPSTKDTSTPPATVTVEPNDSVHATVTYPNPVIQKCKPLTPLKVSAAMPGEDMPTSVTTNGVMCPLESVTPLQAGQ